MRSQVVENAVCGPCSGGTCMRQLPCRNRTERPVRDRKSDEHRGRLVSRRLQHAHLSHAVPIGHARSLPNRRDEHVGRPLCDDAIEAKHPAQPTRTPGASRRRRAHLDGSASCTHYTRCPRTRRRHVRPRARRPAARRFSPGGSALARAGRRLRAPCSPRPARARRCSRPR
jgi:hypothetical protein